MADPVYREVQCFHLIISLDRTGDGGRIWRDCCMLRMAQGQGGEWPRPIPSARSGCFESSRALGGISSTGDLIYNHPTIVRQGPEMKTQLFYQAATIIVWISAFGLGIPCVMAIRNLRAGLGVPLVFGFPAYGGGAFERRGLETTIPLLVGFLLVAILEAGAGGLLWRGHKLGAIASLVLLIPGAVYWWGFDLPYPPVAAVARVALIVLAWPGLA